MQKTPLLRKGVLKTYTNIQKTNTNITKPNNNILKTNNNIYRNWPKYQPTNIYQFNPLTNNIKCLGTETYLHCVSIFSKLDCLYPHLLSRVPLDTASVADIHHHLPPEYVGRYCVVEIFRQSYYHQVSSISTGQGGYLYIGWNQRPGGVGFNQLYRINTDKGLDFISYIE